MCRVDNHMGGLRLGPGGADCDEAVLQLGQSTSGRAALSVDFPKSGAHSLPLRGRLCQNDSTGLSDRHRPWIPGGRDWVSEELPSA